MSINPTLSKALKIVASRFPLSPRPFRELGEELGVGEGECLEEIKQLKLSGVIKGITGFFWSPSMGYKTALIAFKLPEGRLGEVAQLINRHPGISHNCAREGEYNLWFTLHLPKKESFQGEVERLAQKAAVKDYLLLPAIKIFKLTNPLAFLPTPDIRACFRGLSEKEIEATRLLQRDLPLVLEPFIALTSGAKIGAEELIEIGKRFLRERIMRRYAARLDHVKAGFTVNALACFEVDPAKIEDVADFLSSQPQVSHCYLRESYPHWRYNLYAVLHGRSRQELESLSEKTGFHHKLLFTLKEYKRERVRYFADR